MIGQSDNKPSWAYDQFAIILGSILLVMLFVLIFLLLSDFFSLNQLNWIFEYGLKGFQQGFGTCKRLCTLA